MSFTFLLAHGEESSAASFSGIPPCVLSRSNPTVGKSSSNDNATEFSHASPSGTTCEPSTASPGAAASMLSAEASRVRTSQPPEKAQALRESGAGCGERWRELSARYDLVSRSWKTHQCLWVEVLPWSSVTLPRWGMMRAGVLSERITPEPLTSGIESGYWPTPRTTGLDGGSNSRKAAKARGMWPTPTTRDFKGVSGSGRQEKKGHPEDTLPNAVAARMFPTQKSSDGERGGRGDLIAQVRNKPNSHFKMFPTPTANEDSYRLSGNSQQSRILGAMARREAIANAEKFATPQSRDFRTGQKERWENPEKTRNLNDQIGGQLNPTWVEWLMGWPIGWTDLRPLAMDRCRSALRLHGVCFQERGDL